MRGPQSARSVYRRVPAKEHFALSSLHEKPFCCPWQFALGNKNHTGSSVIKVHADDNELYEKTLVRGTGHIVRSPWRSAAGRDREYEEVSVCHVRGSFLNAGALGLQRFSAGAGRYDAKDGILSRRVPNASGRLHIGQCMSNAGSDTPADFEMHWMTPDSPDSKGWVGSSTSRMTRAPRAVSIGT